MRKLYWFLVGFFLVTVLVFSCSRVDAAEWVPRNKKGTSWLYYEQTRILATVDLTPEGKWVVDVPVYQTEFMESFAGHPHDSLAEAVAEVYHLLIGRTFI